MGTGHGRDGDGPREWSRPVPPARVWRDWVLVGVLVPVALLEGLLRPDLPWRPVALALGIGLVPTLLWRRTRPLLMIAIAIISRGRVRRHSSVGTRPMHRASATGRQGRSGRNRPSRSATGTSTPT